jgi:hypothetical protein
MQNYLVLILIVANFFSSSVRFVYTAVDPAFTRSIITYTPSSILLTISFPFTFTSIILITFYWYKFEFDTRCHFLTLFDTLIRYDIISSSSLKIYKFMGKSLKPCIVAIGLIFLAEIATNVTRSIGMTLEYLVSIILIY